MGLRVVRFMKNQRPAREQAIVKKMAKSTFALLLTLLACVAAYSQSRLDPRLVTVPIEINSIPATFLVDTGTERTVVDSAFAGQLGLKLSRLCCFRATIQ